MSAKAYLLGMVELAVLLGATGFAAHRLRQWLAPGLAGAVARLAEVVLTLTLFVLLGQAFGTVGLFKEGPVLVGALVVGLSAAKLGGRGRSPSREGELAHIPEAERGGDRPLPPSMPEESLRLPGVSWGGIAVAVCFAAAILGFWSLHTQFNLDRGMFGFDTMWYHMPFAASFVQEGSVTSLHFTDPLYLNWFYPQNSELLHAIGILPFDRDILSPLFNMGWAGLCLLAAWCIGRPYGAGALSVAAVAILLGSHTLVSRQPGDAKNDIVGMALLLSCAAVLANGWAAGRGRGRVPMTLNRGGEHLRETARPGLASAGPAPGPAPGVIPRGALVIAGLAAGLALGTKLTFIAPVFALTVGVIAIAPAGARFAQGRVWTLAMVATGGFWYLRNLIAAGNPLPWVDLGPLPNPERLVEGRPDFAVSHYLTDGEVWREFFLPGLDVAFGDLWWLMLALALGGAVLAIWRADPMRRMLGAAALFAAVAYLFTPLTASGYEGEPLGFVLNLRYLAPALAIGLALLSTLIPPRARWPWAALVLLGALFVITDEPYRIWRDTYRDGAVVIGLVTLAVGGALYLLHARRAPGPALGLAVAAIAAVGVVAYHPQQRDYLEHRYQNTYTKFHLDSAIRWAREQSGQRIGIAGTTAAFFQYGFYGTDLSNEVEYVGERGAHGAFAPIQSCEEWRRALNEGDYDYLVTTPSFNQQVVLKPRFSPESKWTRGEPAVEGVPEAHERRVSVYRITGRLDPSRCERIKRQFRGIAPQLERAG